MNDSAFAWPALRPESGESFQSGEIEAERAVLGKVHGAASDFRWIARSPGFDLERRPERETSTGLENLPLDGGLWRSTGDRCYAVHCYKSRALDQAGRSTALEKQLLAYKPASGLPLALAALLLLQRAASYDDKVWWERRNLGSWRNPSFSLQLQPVRLSWGADRLQPLIQEAITCLQKSCSAQQVTEFYARLLAGNRPALLEGASQPLPCLALAALLLPLPRRTASPISLAGWIFSSRYDPESIARRWSAVACQRRPARFPQGEKPPSGEQMRRAQNWTQALWENAPQSILRPQPERSQHPQARPDDDLRKAIRLVDAGADWAEVAPHLTGLATPLSRLVEFSLQRQSWWLEPQELANKGEKIAAFSPRSQEAQLLQACLKRAEKEGPTSASPKGWKIKADLLRAACLSFSPAAQTLQRVGWPRSALVPPLLFAPLVRRSDREALLHLGEPLKESLRRSDECPYQMLFEPIEKAFREWAETQGQ